MTTASLTIFRGRSGDRNPRAMAGAERLGSDLARRLGRTITAVSAAEPPIPGLWDVQLAAARPALRGLADAVALALAEPSPTVTVMGRCAAALATLPVIAGQRQDACVVWFDAHGDVNTPDASDSGYLGGLVVSAACGLWDSGLGAGLALGKIILVAARDLDPMEWALIESGALRHVPVGPDLAARLAEAVASRPVYIHLDVDALDAGLVPSEYQVADGLSFADLRAACAVLAKNPLIGLEITEFEDFWPDGRPGETGPLIEALDPLLRVLAAP